MNPDYLRRVIAYILVFYYCILYIYCRNLTKLVPRCVNLDSRPFCTIYSSLFSNINNYHLNNTMTCYSSLRLPNTNLNVKQVKKNVLLIFLNIFKVLFHTQERKILIQKTYKNLNAAGLEPAPPGNRPGALTYLCYQYLCREIFTNFRYPKIITKIETTIILSNYLWVAEICKNLPTEILTT